MTVWLHAVRRLSASGAIGDGITSWRRRSGEPTGMLSITPAFGRPDAVGGALANAVRRDRPDGPVSSSTIDCSASGVGPLAVGLAGRRWALGLMRMSAVPSQARAWADLRGSPDWTSSLCAAGRRYGCSGVAVADDGPDGPRSTVWRQIRRSHSWRPPTATRSGDEDLEMHRGGYRRR